MNPGYRVAWLTSKDARRAAAVEREAFPRGYRAGRRDIAIQLEEADATGENLSVGLYHGARLVGYMLVFLESERRNICEYIGATPPAGLDLSGPGAYIADIAVSKPHRRAVPLMFGRLLRAARTRSDLSGLPVDAYSRADELKQWRRHARAIATFGLELTGVHEFRCEPGDPALFWLTFRQVDVPAKRGHHCLERNLKDARAVVVDGAELQIGYIDTMDGWERLEPEWDALVRATPGATVFQSYEYDRLWWSLLGLDRELFIVTVLKHGKPIAIAPLQLCSEAWLGKTYTTIAFIVDSWESDRPRLLARQASESLGRLVIDYIFDHRDRWNSVYLHEQRADDPFAQAWLARLRAEGFVLSNYEGSGCPVIDIQSGWQDYLAGRSRSLRKSARRKSAAIRKLGDVRLVHARTPAEIETAFETYLAIEEASWKNETGAAVTKSTAHRAFIREVMCAFGGRGQARVSLLYLDDHPVAGTFGLLWDGVYYSLNIVHDERYSRYSPGFLLTYLELEDVFASGDVRRYDFLSEFLSNKVGWATETLGTSSFYAHVSDPRGRLFHLVYFRAKPRIKTTLKRLGVLNPTLSLVARIRRRHRKEYVDH